MRLGRKTFLAASVAAASAAGLADCSALTRAHAFPELEHITYRPLAPDDYDYAQVLATLKVRSAHKQLFVATGAAAPAGSVRMPIFVHMQFAMNGYQFSLPHPIKLATLAVLSGASVVLGVNDAMWKKYGIGGRYGLAQTNVYYPAQSDLNPQAAPDDPKGLYQDFSAQAVLKRGGSLMVCHNALTYAAANCALRLGYSADTCLREWLDNLLPGFILVPAGVTAVQMALEHGWQAYPAS